MPPRIYKDRCNGCGICIFQCGAICFGFDAAGYKAYVSNGKACTDCFICQEMCPVNAIAVRVGKVK